MITFITAFKPFNSVYSPIQKSAVFSYQTNNIPIIAVDTEGDAKEKISGIKFVEGVRTAQDISFKSRSPILKDLLVKALESVQTPLVGLINSDIIIPMDFKNSLQEIILKTGQHGFIVFTRFDLTLNEEINSIKALENLFNKKTTIYDEVTSSDLFISSYENFKKIAEEIPEFILGRYGWDNWLHLYAQVNFKCFNGTKAIKTIHCRHDHSHIVIQEGKPGKSAASSAYNISLLKSLQDIYGNEVRINHWEKLEAYDCSPLS